MFRLLALSGAVLVGSGCPTAAVNYNYATLPDPTGSVYRVKAGDLLLVRVLRNENTTGRYTVRPDGFISLPLGGEIKVEGLSLEEARTHVVERLKRFFQDANDMVSVSLEEVHGVTFSVIGEVQRAGVFESRKHLSVLEALAHAGGLTAYAQPAAIYVLRRHDGRQTKIPVSYDDTVKDPGGNRNFYILTGDIVVVP